MKISKCLCVVECCFLLLSGTAAAFQFESAPGISMGSMVTDNLFQSESNREKELITTISPTVNLRLLTKSHEVGLFYNPTYAVYDKYDENNTLRHTATASGQFALGKNTRLQVSDTFFLTEDASPETDGVAAVEEHRDLLIDSTLRPSRQTHYSNAASVALTHQFGTADTFTVQYLHSILENEDPEIEDSSRHRPSVAVAFWPAPQRIGIEASLGFTRAEFTDATDPFSQWNPQARVIHRWHPRLDTFIRYSHTSMDYDGPTDDYQIYNPSAGLTFTATERSRFTLDVGYYLNDDRRRDENSGMTTNADLTFDFNRGQIRMNGSGGYQETYFGAENLGFSTFYHFGGGATYQIARRVSGTFSGSFRNNRYIETAINREDDTIVGEGGLSVALLPWIRLELNYTYRSIDSSTAGNDYTENRLQFNLSLIPPRPWRPAF